MMEQSVLEFASVLRQLRAEARLTQEELAEAAGLSPRSISDLERGINRTARKDTAELLAGALGLAEPARAVFVAAARGRAPAAEVLAAVRGEASPAADGLAPGESLVWSGCPYLGLAPLGSGMRGCSTGAVNWWPSWHSGWPGGWTGRGCCWWPGSRGRVSPRC